MNKHIRNAYKIALVNTLLILLALSTVVSSSPLNEFQASYLVGLPVILAGILAILGFAQFYKGRNAQRNYQYYLGGFVNFIILLVQIGLFWGFLK